MGWALDGDTNPIPPLPTISVGVGANRCAQIVRPERDTCGCTDVHSSVPDGGESGQIRRATLRLLNELPIEALDKAPPLHHHHTITSHPSIHQVIDGTPAELAHAPAVSYPRLRADRVRSPQPQPRLQSTRSSRRASRRWSDHGALCEEGSTKIRDLTPAHTSTAIRRALRRCRRLRHPVRQIMTASECPNVTS